MQGRGYPPPLRGMLSEVDWVLKALWGHGPNQGAALLRPYA